MSTVRVVPEELSDFYIRPTSDGGWAVLIPQGGGTGWFAVVYDDFDSAADALADHGEEWSYAVTYADPEFLEVPDLVEIEEEP